MNAQSSKRESRGRAEREIETREQRYRAERDERALKAYSESTEKALREH